MDTISTQRMIVKLNDYFEHNGSERRYWQYDGKYFVCYNACSDMDDIDELSERYLRLDYAKYCSNMREIRITEDCEIDWCVEYGFKALNLNTMLFENVSGIGKSEHLVIRIVEDNVEFDESDISCEIIKLKSMGFNIVYALYCDEFLYGYVFENYVDLYEQK